MESDVVFVITAFFHVLMLSQYILLFINRQTIHEKRKSPSDWGDKKGDLGLKYLPFTSCPAMKIINNKIQDGRW